jgi:ABC-type lipoprotein release transport system permease subunit
MHPTSKRLEQIYRAFDPVALALAAIAVLALALVASVIPARRAAAVDPIQALRGE